MYRPICPPAEGYIGVPLASMITPAPKQKMLIRKIGNSEMRDGRGGSDRSNGPKSTNGSAPTRAFFQLKC